MFQKDAAQGKRRRQAVGCLWVVISIALLGDRINSVAATNDVPEGFPDIQLTGKIRGDSAVAALADKLPALAAFYRTSEAELRQRLRRDKSLWVDTRGRLFYVCDWGIPPATNQASPNVGLLAAFPYPETFRLHSRPGATKIIYLDFDGHDASATSWGSDAIGRPFDLDGDSSTFSTTERDRIQYIWQRVAEDYALYDIDVTTEDPGLEALRKSNALDANYGIRVVIGGSSTDWYSSAGGVAYIGSFDWNSDTPCWVWPGSLSNSEKNIAEAASHEAGHTLGLNHDGLTDGTTYYSGQGNWAPIMGVGYNEPIVQWSKGEYANANNTQDDLAVMLGEGISYRPDDHGNSIATATALSGVSFAAEGNIERNTDVDFFSFKTGAGRVDITATPAPRGPNLHILLSLYDANGVFIISTNTADTSAGVLPVTLSIVLPIGTYYFSIDGIGVGNAATTGYSDYASLGEYTIAASLPSDSGWLPTAPGTDYSWTNTVNWAANTIPLGADAVARINNNIAGDQTISLDMPITLGKLFLGDANGTHAFTLQNEAGVALLFNSTPGSAVISKTTGANDTINSTIVLQSDLTVTNTTAASLVMSGVISGSGSLIKMGAGNLVLAAPNTHTGSTIVGGGTLALDVAGAIGNSALVDVRASGMLDVTAAGGLILGNNQTLSGSGAVIGDVTAPDTSQITPGTNGVAGTLSLSNNLTLNSGAKIKFDLSNSPALGGGTNDLIAVKGDLTLTGTVTVDFNFLNGFPASPATYTLLTYSGTLNGGASNLAVASAMNRYDFTFDDSVPGEIRVQISGNPASLTWQGDGLLNRWDIAGTTNWLDAGNPEFFYQFDTVTFDDAGSTAPAVNLTGVLSPNAIAVIGTHNYSFSGVGKISGNASLTKQGTGTLTVNTANDYSGPTLVTGGILKAGNSSALGNVTNGTTVTAGATLDLNAVNLGAEPITLQGNGASGGGAIINSSASTQSNALRFVTLSGDATLGGTGRWDIRANPTASFAGNNFNLTKTGANDIWFAEVGASGLGNINVLQGQMVLQGSTTLGDSTKTLTVETNAAFVLYNTDNNVLNKKLVMNNARLHSLAGDNIFSGSITLNGSNTITASAIFSLQGALSGPGGLTKVGSGILALSASNSYAGTSLISAGTLMAKNSWALGSTNGGTTISPGARLDINGINLGAEPVIASGTGLGNAGAIINNGASQQNALRFVTLTGNTTFGGIGRWDIRANPTGSLNVTNFNLTKIGINEVWLANLGPNGLSGITVSEGLLGILGSTTLGNVGNTLAINSSASLGISGLGSNILNKVVTMSSGRIFNSSGSNVLFGTISLSSSNRFDIASGTTLMLGGPISGSGALHKITAGTLLLRSNNTYTGVTTVQAGLLQIGDGGAGGSPGTGNITNNATLTFNRSTALTVSNQISGTGALNQNGIGTLTLNGNNTYSNTTTINAGSVAVGSDTALGFGTVSFNAAATSNVMLRAATAATRTLTNNLVANCSVVFGAPATGDLFFNGPGLNCGAVSRTLTVFNTNTTINNPIAATATLIKDGPGTLVFGGNNSYVGGTTILLGTLRIDAENRLGNNPAPPFKPAHLTLNGGALQTTATFSIDDSNRGVTLGSSGGTFTINPATALTVANAITGTGSLTKLGTGTLILSAVNNYTSNTVISGGSLALSGAGSIAASPVIRVDGGANFDGSGVSGNFVLGNNQTFMGNGAVTGNLIANGTVSPGNSIGRLTFNDSLVLAGTTAMEINKSGTTLTNDVISVAGTVTFGGALVVTHTGNALTNGDSFQLFSAAAYAESFASKNLPALNPGLRWNTAQLEVTGTIRVESLAAPQILPVVFDGANLLISVQSDAGVTYVLETTEDLIPTPIWTGVATNVGTGEILIVPVPVDTTLPQKFFRFTAY